jgi:FixJ family two-component response regulator
MQETATRPTAATTAAAAAATSAGAARPAVLFVDDEEQALKYFPKVLAKGFEVFTANSAAAAVGVLEAHGERVGVIVSDQRMPGRTGVDLLIEVRRRWPAIVRILLTAYADLDSAIAAVNAGAIHKYLNKPIELEPMRQTLEEALALFGAQAEREALLRGRLSELQRVIVADRVTSIAAMADGISHHLRNSMTAMSCFLEELAADASARPATPQDEYLAELWRLARAERETLLQIVRGVAEAARAPESHPTGEVALEPVVRQAVAAVAAEVGPERVTCEVPAEVPALKADGARLVELVSTLVRHVARRCEPGRRCRFGRRRGRSSGAWRGFACGWWGRGGRGSGATPRRSSRRSRFRLGTRRTWDWSSCWRSTSCVSTGARLPFTRGRRTGRGLRYCCRAIRRSCGGRA